MQDISLIHFLIILITCCNGNTLQILCKINCVCVCVCVLVTQLCLTL